MTGINATECVTLSAGDLDKTMSGSAALGFTEVRYEVPWSLVPSASSPGWASVLAVEAAAAKYGLKTLPILGVHHPATISAAAFGVFCANATKVIRGDRYEIWNEPNLETFWAKGNPETFAPYLNNAHDAIKAVTPGAQVLVGGLAACVTYSGLAFVPYFPFLIWYTNTAPVEFLTRLYAAKARFDGVCYHPYALTPGMVEDDPSPLQPMIANIATLRKLMDSKGDQAKPLVLTEWGFSAGGAATVTKRLEAEWPLLPYENFLYQLRDYGSTFGLEDANFNAKPNGLTAWIKAKLGK